MPGCESTLDNLHAGSSRRVFHLVPSRYHPSLPLVAIGTLCVFSLADSSAFFVGPLKSLEDHTISGKEEDYDLRVCFARKQMDQNKRKSDYLFHFLYSCLLVGKDEKQRQLKLFTNAKTGSNNIRTLFPNSQQSVINTNSVSRIQCVEIPYWTNT